MFHRSFLSFFSNTLAQNKSSGFARPVNSKKIWWHSDAFPQWNHKGVHVNGIVTIEIVASFASHRFHTEFLCNVGDVRTKLDIILRCIRSFACRLNFSLYDTSRLHSVFAWHHDTYHWGTVGGRTRTLMFVQAEQLVLLIISARSYKRYETWLNNDWIMY